MATSQIDTGNDKNIDLISLLKKNNYNIFNGLIKEQANRQRIVDDISECNWNFEQLKTMTKDEFAEQISAPYLQHISIEQQLKLLHVKLCAWEDIVDQSKITKSISSDAWTDIIADRTAETMKKETAIKFDLDKKNSNVYKRLTYVQTLFKQIHSQADEKSDNQSDKKQDKTEEEEFWKPIDDIFDITRGNSKQIGEKVGVYSISSEADMSLDCNFSLTGPGQWYYEVELLEDPATYKDLNIGFANKKHSARNEVGFDGDSYGYNGIKNKIFNMNTAYGKTKWKAGDILGFAADGNKNIEFYLNGVSQGIAFESIDCVGNLSAGFTLQRGQNGVFIYEESKLKQSKPDGYNCIEINNGSKQDEIWKIDGDIKCETVDNGIKITANAGFPTAVLQCELSVDKKYYFEFELTTAGCMQLGFADSEFKANAARGQGIGDDSHSWGCDLMRMQKWGIFGSTYCNANWTKGDIIGCCLDLDQKCIAYSLNGKDLGVAFKGIDCTKAGGLYPCISVRNIDARNKMLEIYQKKREATGNEADEIKMPEPIAYFNLIFSENAYKHKPNGSNVNAITNNVAFKAMDICNSLVEYSYEQYKEDYSFMDSVIMLSRDDEFDEICKKVDKNTLIVCDFWATWCGPCIYIAPHYHEMSHEFKNVVFLKADVDKLKKFSQEKAINCMPTFKFFKDSKEIHKIEGADKDAIIAAVKKYSQ